MDTKDTYFNIRVNAEMKEAFKELSLKRGLKMSSIIIDLVRKEIEKEGIQIGKFIDKNQTSLFD